LHQQHCPLRLHLLDEQREHQEAKSNHQQHDRRRPGEETVVTEDRPETLVEEDDRVRRGPGDPVEEVHRLYFLGGAAANASNRGCAEDLVPGGLVRKEWANRSAAV
jgi:hypothetical protein